MKGNSNLGYKVFGVIALVIIIASATARGFRPVFVYYSPQPDTTTNKDSIARATDSLHKLRFPIYDKTGDPVVQEA